MVFCFFVFSRFEPNDFFLSFENFRTTKRKHAAKAWLPSLHLSFEKALCSMILYKNLPKKTADSLGRHHWFPAQWILSKERILHYPDLGSALPISCQFTNDVLVFHKLFQKGARETSWAWGSWAGHFAVRIYWASSPSPYRAADTVPSKVSFNVPRGYTKFFFECWDIFQHEKRIFKRGACNVLFMIFC